jgi:hypothetical protein
MLVTSFFLNVQNTPKRYQSHVFRFDLADSATDDGKTLRVQLKFPGKSVFTVWEPEDERLSKTYKLPAANLTHARKVYSKHQHIEESAVTHKQRQEIGPTFEQTCKRRFDHLSLYNAYGFGIPEILAEFFERNLGLFILLITISVTISAVSGKFLWN